MIYKNEIKSSCKELHTAKKFSMVYSLTDKVVKNISNKNWFYERAFDKFLCVLLDT